MSLRRPTARDLKGLWQALRDGVQSAAGYERPSAPFGYEGLTSVEAPHQGFGAQASAVAHQPVTIRR